MKYFELVTGSVTSFCITKFRKSLLQLENSEPHKFVILGKSQPEWNTTMRIYWEKKELKLKTMEMILFDFLKFSI